MNKNTLFTPLILVLSLSCFSLKAQQDIRPSVPDIPQAQSQEMAKPGTYQLIRTGKTQEAIHTGLLIEIESHRQQNEVYYFALSPNTSIRILPFSEINAPNFIPLTDLYFDQEESNRYEK